MFDARAQFFKTLRAAAVIVLCITAMTAGSACNPPLGDSHDSSQAASADDETDAAMSLPVSGDVVLTGGWTSGGKSTATAEFFNPTTKKFVKTGSMKVAAGLRAGAFLESGEILVGGGFTGKSTFTHKTADTKVTGDALTDLEIYDPTTGDFTAASGSLITERVGATATLLSSGKILIAGGANSSGTPTDTAEVFDPTTGKTTATANNMSSPRALHTATLMDDGTVLLAGGATDSTGDVTATADVYDPTANTFSPTLGTMDIARGAHAAVDLTPTGGTEEVLITGGFEKPGTNLAPTIIIESYDPVGQVFYEIGITNDPRAFHTATLLPSGTVLLAGGYFTAPTVSGGNFDSLFGTNLSSAEIFDPVAVTSTCINGENGKGGYTCSPAMKMGRGAHTATLFTGGPLSGQVLIAGGIGAKVPASTASELKEAELFNPSTNTFTATGSLTSARGLHDAFLLP